MSANPDSRGVKQTLPLPTQMADCLAQLICDASDKHQLDAVPIEEVTRWIQMALALEKDAQQLSYVKRLVMETRAAIEAHHSSFQASEILHHFKSTGQPSAILIGFALAELAQEGVIACLDQGAPATFAYLIDSGAQIHRPEKAKRPASTGEHGEGAGTATGDFGGGLA